MPPRKKKQVFSEIVELSNFPVKVQVTKSQLKSLDPYEYVENSTFFEGELEWKICTVTGFKSGSGDKKNEGD